MFIINYYLVINIVSFVVVIMVNLPPIWKVDGCMVSGASNYRGTRIVAPIKVAINKIGNM